MSTGWQSERRTIEDMRRAQAVPAAEFPGHKGIYLANLEGYLGANFPALLAERDRLYALLVDAAELVEALAAPRPETDPEGESWDVGALALAGRIRQELRGTPSPD